jgi:hypothetical protein
LLIHRFLFIHIPISRLIYKDAKGVMIHGLGQPHNADVLMEPPFQIPFYFPSRILVECKNTKEKVDLPTVRNAHGLRQDINSFEIVTPDILIKRRNYKRNCNALYDYERYQYQVAIASLSGYKNTAQEYAITHRIPLISFESSIYTNARKFLLEIEDIEKNLSVREINKLKDFLKNQDLYYHEFYIMNFINEPISVMINNFLDEAKSIIDSSYIGVLENGTIIVLILRGNMEKINFTNKCTIHWNKETGIWKIRSEANNYWEFQFELPEKLFNYWAGNSFDREIALNIKEKYFRKIFVFANRERNNRQNFFILELSYEFIKRARKSYYLIDNED